jgi:hypothetical protein
MLQRLFLAVLVCSSACGGESAIDEGDAPLRICSTGSPGDILRENVGTNGLPSDGTAEYLSAAISQTGRYIVFTSTSTVLVNPPPPAGYQRVYWRDTCTGVTRVVIDSSMTTDGQWPDADVYYPSVTADGRYVTFLSGAHHLTSATVPNCSGPHGCEQVYIRDMNASGVSGTTLVSGYPDNTVPVAETYQPVVAATYGANVGPGSGGPYVAFVAQADVRRNGGGVIPGNAVFVRDMGSATTIAVSMSAVTHLAVGGTRPSISADGSFIGYTGTPEIVSLSGPLVAIRAQVLSFSNANVAELFLGPGTNGATPNAAEYNISISADGTRASFDSNATNLDPGAVAGQANVFVAVITVVSGAPTATVSLVSFALGGTVEGNASSSHPSISPDGNSIVFMSDASNLIASDTNQTVSDVFRRDVLAGVTQIASVDASGNQENAASTIDLLAPASQAANARVIFQSAAHFGYSGTHSGLFMKLF